MNHYPHHIGDFNNATRHLTRVERSLYRDAIELYYDKEEPLTGDFKRLARKLSANTEEEKEALEFVLEEFFYLVDGVYKNDRCEEELLSYRNNSSNKSKAGKASAEARRKRAEQRRQAQGEQDSTGDEQVFDSVNSGSQQNPTNQEPVTKNQEPINTGTNVPVETDVSTESPSEKISKPKKSDLIPYKQIVELYREILCPALPDITKLSPARQAQVRARHQDIETLDGWRSYFELVQSAPHLMGKTPPTPDRPQSWKADFDWLIKEANFLKVIEGKYHGN